MKKNTRAGGVAMFIVATGLVILIAVLAVQRRHSSVAAAAPRLSIPEVVQVPTLPAVDPPPMPLQNARPPSDAGPAPRAAALPPAAPVVEGNDVPSYAQRLAGERVDPKWGRETRAALQDGLRTLESKDARVNDVDCRTTICRVSATFANNDARLDFVRKGFLMANQSVMYSINSPIFSPPPTVDGDEVRSIIYVLRPDAEDDGAGARRPE